MIASTSDPAAWRPALAAYIQLEALPAEKYGHQRRLYALTQFRLPTSSVLTEPRIQAHRDFLAALAAESGNLLL